MATIGIKIDTEACVGCGACVTDCMSCVFLLDESSKSFMVHPEACIGCGHCAAICPTAAITATKEGFVTPEPHTELEKAIMMRRSIRTFSQEPMSHEEITDLLRITMSCASASNKRPLHFTVIEHKDCMPIGELVAEAFTKVPGYENVGKLQRAGKDVVFRGAPYMLVVSAPFTPGYSPVEDAAIALTTFELQAQSKGVGTFWCGFLTKTAQSVPEITAALGLPEGHTVLSCMGFGRSNVEFARPAPREDIVDRVHFR